MQQMEQDKQYVPCSAKATDLKITLSHGAKEDEERVSFLEQQIQQAKDSYESSLKTVIKNVSHWRSRLQKGRNTVNHGSAPHNWVRHSNITRY